MLASLPIAAYVLLALAFIRHGSDGRSAVLHAATGWGVLAVLVTETLSIPGWLTPAGLGVAWLFVDAAVLVVVARAAEAGRDGGTPGLRAAVARMDRVDLVLLGGAGFVIALVGVVALLSPPNTWDAMQYHLPRIVHWIQNQSARLYPTHELKQLHMAPGAEYLMLQLHALWGGDRLDNLVQWSAMAGCVVGVTLLARALGAGSRGQALAAVVCATIPEGILAASGAKNDYVLSLWLVALAFYALRFGREPGWLNGAGIGAGLGLAWLTKGTAYALAPPVLVTLAVFWPWRAKVALLRRLPLVVLLVLGLNAAHFARNATLFGSPLGPAAEDPAGAFKYTNDVISLPLTLSNALRNAVVHVRSEHRATNAVIEAWVARILRPLGADPHDPRANFFSFMPFQLPEVEIHEGFAGNPAHLALVAITLVMLLVTGSRADRGAVGIYALALVLSFVAFSALLKWQPMGARLHLPLFVLWSAAIGVVIGNAWPALVARGLAAMLLLLALPIATGNTARPLRSHENSVLTADRPHLYFGDRRGVAREYLAAVDLAKKTGCRSIGLELSGGGGGQYEYALLALLDAGQGTRIEAVDVSNASRRYARRDVSFEPCLLICVQCERIRALWVSYGGRGATAVAFGDIVVFTPGKDS